MTTMDHEAVTPDYEPPRIEERTPIGHAPDRRGIAEPS